MDWLLIGATIVSLALAVAMSGIAWRLLRHDRERSAARIEALEAMAFESPESPPARRERADPSWDAVLGGEPRDIATPLEAPIQRVDREEVVSRPLFDDPPPGRVFVRRSVAVGAMVLVLAAVTGMVALARSPSLLAVLSASMPAGNRPAVNAIPLELLSLRHVVDPTGVFSVTGLVHNPSGGRDIEQLEAVVYLFDETGQFFTSARAPLEIPTLGPGDESPFVVRISTAGTISRYRVGFRRADGRAVAHVDHRGQLPEGTTGDVVPVEPDVVTRARATRPDSMTPGGGVSR